MLTPQNIILHKHSRQLEIQFEDKTFFLSAEYLRIFSPSAEVQGHGPEQATLVIGKQLVNIVKLEPVGYYAIKIYFDDQHSSGLYTWEYLYELGKNQENNWKNYLNKIKSTRSLL